jgi:hypothetical protein
VCAEQHLQNLKRKLDEIPKKSPHTHTHTYTCVTTLAQLHRTRAPPRRLSERVRGRQAERKPVTGTKTRHENKTEKERKEKQLAAAAAHKQSDGTYLRRGRGNAIRKANNSNSNRHLLGGTLKVVVVVVIIVKALTERRKAKRETKGSELYQPGERGTACGRAGEGGEGSTNTPLKPAGNADRHSSRQTTNSTRKKKSTSRTRRSDEVITATRRAHSVHARTLTGSKAHI